MKYNFRQGIVRAPLVSGSPSFLVYNPGNNTMTVAVGVDMVRVSAAYGNYNYLIEEREDSTDAWGPFEWNLAWGPEPVGNYTVWMYWDINRATGLVSRGFTPRQPAFGQIEPVSPSADQHWFDTNTNIMKVWDSVNSIWRKTIRVFAGSFTSGTGTIIENQLGSQVSITSLSGNQNDWPDHGYIIFGADMKGIRYNDTNFVTSATPTNTFHGSFTSPFRLELLNSTVLAAEPIPAFYAVTNDGDGYVRLASGTNDAKRPIGIVMDRDVNPGDPVDIVSHGIAFNDQWNWDVQGGDKDLYCNSSGSLIQGSTDPNGSTRIGAILGPQTVLIDIDQYGSGGGGGGGGGNMLLEQDVDVIGTNVGAVEEGFTFAEGLSFTEFVLLVSQKTLPPSYAGPSVSISSNPAPGSIEVGTVLSPIISRAFTLNDAGAETATALTKNAVEIATAFPFTDTGITIGTSSIVYAASVDYSQGACKLDNRGNIDCTGRINAGTLNSNSITFIGSRKAFAGTPVATPGTSAAVRALVQSSFNSSNNTTVNASGTAISYPAIPSFVITIPIGATRVVFAYPATARVVASVKYQELSYSEVKANFTETTVSVEGANAFTAIPYRVYTYIPVEPFSAEVHYEVYI